MQYKKGKNDYDLCCSVDLKELKSSTIYICKNNSGSKSYKLDSTKKALILNGLALKGININNVKWVGEIRTQMRDGSMYQFGYSSFIDKE